MKTANYYCGTRAGKKVHVVIISDGASQVGGEGIEVSGKREAAQRVADHSGPGAQVIPHVSHDNPFAGVLCFA